MRKRGRPFDSERTEYNKQKIIDTAVELIKKHDMRSKAIDERIKSQNEKN